MLLYGLTQEQQLAASLFPLGGYTKAEIRKRAARLGCRWPPKEGKSRDLFHPRPGLPAFYRKVPPPFFRPGKIVDQRGMFWESMPG